MYRVSCLIVLVSLLFHPAAAADPARTEARQATSSSTGKRVAWTLIGAGLGFGAGLFFGLRQFDDAITSDRKVWASALVGAAAGGVAGALLSRGGSSSPALRPSPPIALGVDEMALATTAGASHDPILLRRVRAYNDTAFTLSSGSH